ncbi:MAG: VWA domain-containing protein [Acidobacteriaceae bacterium]
MSKRNACTLASLLSLAFSAYAPIASAIIRPPQQLATDAAQSKPSVARSEPLDQAVDAEGLIRLRVVATDTSGNPVTGLPRSAFTILDDGHPQNTIAFRESNALSDDPDAGATILLIIDTLDVPYQLAYLERQQAINFLRSNSGRLTHPTVLYLLDDKGCFLAAKSTRDGNALAEALAFASQSDASVSSPRVKMPLIEKSILKTPLLAQLRALAAISTPEDRLSGKKLILWIRAQPAKRAPLAENPGSSERTNLFGDIYCFSTLLRQAGISLSLFTVQSAFQAAHPLPPDEAWQSHLAGVPSAKDATWSALDLNVLAVQSGGSVNPTSQDILQQLNDTIHQQASIYYQLTFDPPLAAHTDDYHSLRVTVSEPGVTATTVTGYYDQPFYDDATDPSARPVTVAQLEQLIQAAHGGVNAARQLPNLLLTQRLSIADVNSLSAQLHSKSARTTLHMIADESKFLDPPPSVALPDPPPDLSTQQRILTSAVAYLDNVIPKLPDFFATRNATYYTETAAYHELDTSFDPVPLHAAQQSQSTVLYSNDREVIDAAKHPQATAPVSQMRTSGIFGPILKQLRAVLSMPAISLGVAGSPPHRVASQCSTTPSQRSPPSTSPAAAFPMEAA